MLVTELDFSEATASLGLLTEPPIGAVPILPTLSANEPNVVLSAATNVTRTSLSVETLSAVMNPLVFAGTSADETIISSLEDDILTGGGGQDIFIFTADSGNDVITDFGGVGGGGRGEKKLLPEYDVLKFNGSGLTAENMLLSYDGQNTTFTFAETPDFQLILRDFEFTDLDNLPSGTSNIIFDGESVATDSYDVANDNRTRKIRLFNKNIITAITL